MGCLEGITKAITNECTNRPAAGLEPLAWVLNRGTFTPTTTLNVVSNIVNIGAATSFLVTMAKKEVNVGADLISADNLPDLFSNYFSIQPYERDAESLSNIENMDDIVIIVELKGPKEEGKFVIYGLESGLHKNTSSWRANDNFGLPTYEFATREGETETYSKYVLWDTDYDTTLTIIEGLLT